MLTQQKDHWKEEHTHDAFILVVVRVVYMHMQVSGDKQLSRTQQEVEGCGPVAVDADWAVEVQAPPHCWISSCRYCHHHRHCSQSHPEEPALM